MVIVKKSKDALEFWLEESGNYGELKDALLEKLNANKAFYSGLKQPVLFFGQRFSQNQKREISSRLANEYGFADIRFVDDEAAEAPVKKPGSGVPMDAVVQRTLRSGQRVESRGGIVVLGDVNTGAELVAGGSIAVFGKLRGLAHAGAYGDANACIAATELLSSQIRIADKIALIPSARRVEGPEFVSIAGGEIQIKLI